jgi:hypothetical protein
MGKSAMGVSNESTVLKQYPNGAGGGTAHPLAEAMDDFCARMRQRRVVGDFFQFASLARG